MKDLEKRIVDAARLFRKAYNDGASTSYPLAMSSLFDALNKLDDASDDFAPGLDPTPIALAREVLSTAEKATPRPWRVMRDGNQYVGEDGSKLVGASRIEEVPRARNPNRLAGWPLLQHVTRFRDEDAAFIVTACNAAEALSRAVIEGEERERGLEQDCARMASERACEMVDKRKAEWTADAADEALDVAEKRIAALEKALARACDGWRERTIQLDANGLMGPSDYADERQCIIECESAREPLPEDRVDLRLVEELFDKYKRPDEQKWCNAISPPSFREAIAEAYARGRVDGIEAEKKAGVVVYESREEWAKRAHDLARAVLNPAAASHTELNNMADEILARG